MRYLKQSTAIEVKVGPFVDATDGVTAETALTISQADVRLAKNEGDWAQKNESTTLVHEENGWYRCLLDATDTNTLGILMLAIAESGALPVWVEFSVCPANIYDSLFSTDKLQVDVQEWLGTAAATPTTAGVPEVDITHIAGSAVSTSTAQLGVNAVQAGGTAWGSGAITAASIASDAITAAKIATDAIGADELADNAITAATIASDAITAAKIATDAITADKIAADAIGSSELATSAVTEIQSGLSTLDAAGIRTAVGLASANLDTQLGDLPTANENADALLDRTAGIETGFTLRQWARLVGAVLLGKASGMGTTANVFRDLNDTKDRISATVDSSGNRTAVGRDAS